MPEFVIGKISCKDCKQELPGSFLDRHSLINCGALRSFHIAVTFFPMADGKQHCVVRCDDCVKMKGVTSACFSTLADLLQSILQTWGHHALPLLLAAAPQNQATAAFKAGAVAAAAIVCRCQHQQQLQQASV